MSLPPASQVPPDPGLDYLTDDEFKRLSEALSSKGITSVTACELCKQAKFSINRLVTSPQPMTPPSMPGGIGAMARASGRAMPSVALICSNCGNSKQINLLILGIRRA